MYWRHAKESKIQMFEYKDCNGGLHPLRQIMLRTVTKHNIQYNVDEVFVIPRRIAGLVVWYLAGLVVWYLASGAQGPRINTQLGHSRLG